MKFRAAVILASGRQIVVLEVHPNVFNDHLLQEEITVHAMRTLGVTHVVLMMLDGYGVPTFLGSDDEVNLLADSDIENYPWRDYPYPQE